MLKSLMSRTNENGEQPVSLLEHLTGDDDEDDEAPVGRSRRGSVVSGGGFGEGGGAAQEGDAASMAESQRKIAPRKKKPKPPPTKKLAVKKEVVVPPRAEASKMMDLHGSVMFLRGKLKEFTDLMGGPDAIVAKQQDRREVQEMAMTLSSLLAGQDDMTRRIEQGLSLHDASRHRPDLSMGDPMGGLKRFTDVKLAALMFYFGREGMDMVVQRWCECPVESFLSSVVIELLHYLERFSSRAKECQTLVNIVTTFTKTVDKVVLGRLETMTKEPDLIWMNMHAAADKELGLREGQGEDETFAYHIILSWLKERDETLLAAMEVNLEEKSRFGGQPMWGQSDTRGNRLLVFTPWFNYLDFVADLVDYAYAKGHVFKPTSKPITEWLTEDVVVWVQNLRLGHYADNFQAMGLNGAALLEMNGQDLLNDVMIDNDEDRKKVIGSLDTLRAQAKYEPMKPLLREIREIQTITVPGGAVGGEDILVTDPEGHKVNLRVPEYNHDHTEKMTGGMTFKHTFSYQKQILNKWKVSAFSDEGGLLRAGASRNSKSLWKGATGKVKMMNATEGRISRELRMAANLVTLRLSAMEVSAKECEVLADFLLVNAVVKRLELSFNKFGSAGSLSLCKALKQNRRVEEIAMSNNKIGDEGALAFAELLRVSETIREVDLGENQISEEGGVALVLAAKTSPPLRDKSNKLIEGTHSLQRLMLYGNECGPDTMATYARAVRKNQHLEVDLTDNPVGDHGMPHLAKILRKYWKQRRLDLRSMRFGHDGLRYVAVACAIRSFRTVTTLFLSNNALGPEGAKHVALLLEKNMTITDVDLSGCELQDEGVRHICSAIGDNEGVEKMDLGDNGITDLGVATLASTLGKKGQKSVFNPHLNPLTIKSICMTTNPISSNGLAAYSGIINVCRLEKLEMSSCKITDAGCKVLATYLLGNRSLTLLDLSSNFITADGLWGMVDALQKDKHIAILRMNDNRLLDSGGRGIATILTKNRAMKEVNIAGNGIGPAGVIPIAKSLCVRPIAMELWLNGNSFLQDYKARIAIELLPQKNSIVTCYT